MRIKLLILLLIFLALKRSFAQAPGFPGAEGYGAKSVGGRGGQVIYVTNLNDAGPGSFREACLKAFPRIICFKVSGNINLLSRLTIGKNNSYLTIAGQTAPGEGVQLTGFDVSINGAHDITIRYMKFRPGHTGINDWSKHALMIYGDDNSEAFNIILDHCSFYWGPDENVSTWDKVRDVTIQWSLSEGMAHDLGTRTEESKGGLFGTEPGDGSRMKNISMHHCYLANSAQRNPMLCGDGPIELVNNVIYNWRDFGTQVQNRGTGTKLNLVGNYYKRGPVSGTSRYAIAMEGSPVNPDAYVYVKDNIGPFRSNAAMDEWAIMGSGYDAGTYWTKQADKKYQRIAPWTWSAPAITTDQATDIPSKVLAEVGASKQLDAYGQLNTKRDVLDQRLVSDYNSNTGTIKKASQFSVSWFPSLQKGIAYTDTDNDGMADEWEKKYCYDPNNAADNSKDTDGDGYTNIEEFLNGSNPQIPGCNPTGLEAVTLQVNLAVYPNPAKELTLIHYELQETAVMKISLYNLIGEEIMQIADESQLPGLYDFRIYTSRFTNGVYLLNIRMDNKRMVRKLIINNHCCPTNILQKHTASKINQGNTHLIF